MRKIKVDVSWFEVDPFWDGYSDNPMYVRKFDHIYYEPDPKDADCNNIVESRVYARRHFMEKFEREEIHTYHFKVLNAQYVGKYDR